MVNEGALPGLEKFTFGFWTRLGLSGLSVPWLLPR